MGDFQHCIDRILAEEGGQSNHPADPGGLTKFGISQRAYPTRDIAHLTLAEALYRRDYWHRAPPITWARNTASMPAMALKRVAGLRMSAALWCRTPASHLAEHAERISAPRLVRTTSGTAKKKPLPM